MLTHTRAVGDILTKFAVRLQNDGVPRDLTGKTVKFNMYTLAGVQVVSNGTVNVSGILTGDVEYDFQSPDVANAGTFKAWFVVLDGALEPDTYPADDDGIEIIIFNRAGSTVPATPEIDILEMATVPIRTRTVEGTVEERSINELIKADQYTQAKDAVDKVPWGIRISRIKPGGTVT